MTATMTPLSAWLDATQDLRRSIFEAAYTEALEAIDADRKKRGVKQGLTHTQHEKARMRAKAEVTRRLYHTEEHNGVRNPAWDDEEWGPNAKAQEPTHTPNKYAGKCVKCQGWIEAEAGKLVKVNGRFGAEHIGECPKAAPRPNNYAGTCGTCGQHVEPQQGRIEKSDAGQWVTFHLDGQCPEATEAEATVDGIDLSGLVPGYYAVPDSDSRLKVAISTGRKGGKWEGFWFVKDGAEYGQQKRYGMQRPGQAYNGQIQDELRAILADPKAAMQAYGKLVGRCGACGRVLEDEDSVRNGIGPICAMKW